MNVVRAEWIKFATVQSPRWCYAAVAASAVLLAIATTISATQMGIRVTPLTTANGVNGFGLVIFMVLAAMQSTTEYHTGTMALTFQVSRSRTMTILVKTLLVALVSAAVAAILAVAAVAIGSAVDHSTHPLQVTGPLQTRLYLGMPLVAFAACFLASGAANLIRSTAGAVATVIIWPIVIEGLVPSIPNVGKSIASWLPFDNATYFLGDSQGIPFAWNDDAAVLALLVWAAATFTAGLLRARLRDTN